MENITLCHLEAVAPIESLLEAVSSLPRHQVVQFVKDLDLTYAEWELTEELASYFEEQMAGYREAEIAGVQ